MQGIKVSTHLLRSLCRCSQMYSCSYIHFRDLYKSLRWDKVALRSGQWWLDEKKSNTKEWGMEDPILSVIRASKAKAKRVKPRVFHPSWLVLLNTIITTVKFVANQANASHATRPFSVHIRWLPTEKSIPPSHLSPLYPEAQRQLYPVSGLLEQLAPLRHGDDSQKSLAAERPHSRHKDGQMFCYRKTCRPGSKKRQLLTSNTRQIWSWMDNCEITFESDIFLCTLWYQQVKYCLKGLRDHSFSSPKTAISIGYYEVPRHRKQETCHVAKSSPSEQVLPVYPWSQTHSNWPLLKCRHWPWSQGDDTSQALISGAAKYWFRTSLASYDPHRRLHFFKVLQSNSC